MQTFSPSSAPDAARGRRRRATTPFTLPALPYADDALEPAITARTLGFHHGRHHQAYVDNLNALVVETRYADMPLAAIIAETAGLADQAGIFHNAAQHWNHSFFWQSLRPNGGGDPPAALGRLIEASFGSIAACRHAFGAVANAHFGSGWAWLVLDGGRLQVLTTADAAVPTLAGAKALLAIDLWEHAYYLDHQHRRAAYIEAVIDGLLDWDFAAHNAIANG